MYWTNCEDEGRVAISKNSKMSEESKDCGRTDSADIIHTQNCTIYQLRLPGKFSPLDPGALLSESFSVLRGSSRAAIIPTTIWRLPSPSLPSQISDQIWSMRDQTSSNSSSLGKFLKSKGSHFQIWQKHENILYFTKKERIAPKDACIQL